MASVRPNTATPHLEAPSDTPTGSCPPPHGATSPGVLHVAPPAASASSSSTPSRGFHRGATLARRTNETELRVRVDLDGTGRFSSDIGVPFFEHMLNLFARHALIDLEVTGQGDLHVDAHHTVEDTGIVLGQAVKAALGDKAGIARYGDAHIPMEETLARCVLDLCNRPYFRFDAEIPKTKVGTFDAELGEEFLRAFAMNVGATLHLALLTPGGNVHHQLEALFKATGLALGRAAAHNPRVHGVLSTKGDL